MGRAKSADVPLSPQDEKDFDACLKQIQKVDIGFEWNVKELRSKSQLGRLVTQRSMVAHILRKKYSLEVIGELLGGRTHATVLNMLRHKPKESNDFYETWLLVTQNDELVLQSHIANKSKELAGVKSRLRKIRKENNLPADAAE